MSRKARRMNIMALSPSALAAAAALTFPWIREMQRLRALGAPGDEDGGGGNGGGGGGDKDRKSPPQPDHCSPGKPCTKGKDGDEMRAPQ
ncbi:MAG: hypothetical protein QOI35_2532 [Cryptosporangiaceae bacterium]|nr:hypothetical protein [Cryptosporangiaceae bacterium]